MKYQLFALSPILLLGIIGALLFLLIGQQKHVFAKEIAACNSEATELRFSCYRYVIEKHYGKHSLDFIDRLGHDDTLSFEETFAKNKEVSYANFGTNCHTFYHAAGDFIAAKMSGEDLKTLLGYGPTTCTNGYTMGVYKRVALQNNFSTDLMKKFFEFCKEGAENQCAHEIGHVLQDKYSYSVLKILDELLLKQYGVSQQVRYNYVTFPGTKPDLNAPFEECKQAVPEKKLVHCFSGIGHNLFLFSEFAPDGYESVFDECAQAEDEHQTDCYAFLIYRIGINDAAPKFLSNKFEAGNKICQQAVMQAGREDLTFHCYVGIGGGIGLFVDSNYIATKVTDENLAQVKHELLNFALLCEKSEKQFIDNCFAGLFGTRFATFYQLLKIYHQRIEELLPTFDTDFEVVG